MDVGEPFPWHSFACSSCFRDVPKSAGDNGGHRHSELLDCNGMAGDRRRAAASMANPYDHSLCLCFDFLPQLLVVIEVGACLAFYHPVGFGVFFREYFLNFLE
jgi:hypothetical protein